MSFAIIKNEEILYFSEEKPNIEDLEFDEIIDLQEDYDYKKDYKLVDWEIKIKIKDEFNLSLINQNKKTEILTKLWELKNRKDWMELLWEDLTEINLEIDNLKLEYNNLN